MIMYGLSKNIFYQAAQRRPALQAVLVRSVIEVSNWWTCRLFTLI